MTVLRLRDLAFSRFFPLFNSGNAKPVTSVRGLIVGWDYLFCWHLFYQTAHGVVVVIEMQPNGKNPNNKFRLHLKNEHIKTTH